MSMLHFFLVATLNTQFHEPLIAPEIRRALPVSIESRSPESARSKLAIDASHDIRIAPLHASDAEQLASHQLAVADEYFDQKDVPRAADEYEKFLCITTPHDPHRDQALFRLGECLRKLENSTDLNTSATKSTSQAIYQQLLQECTKGIFAAGGAYRLGEIYQRGKEIQKAVTAFEQASLLCDDPKIINAAHYQAALCYDELGNEVKALELFHQVVREEGPQATAAQMEIARHEEKAGNLEKALELYQSLAKEPSEKIAAQALVKAGTIDYRLGKKEEASQFFSQAASLANTEEWRSIAALSLMKISYEKKDYRHVIQTSDQALNECQGEEKIQAIFLTGQAMRQLGDFKSALPLYDQVIAQAPTSSLAHEASLMRLLVLHSLKNPSLLGELEIFLHNTSDPNQQTQAQLLKAETLFEAGNYAEAARAYDELKNTNLSLDLKADALYKEAWAWNQAGNTREALQALSTWMGSAPQSAQMPAALIQRASIEQKTGDFTAAIADFKNIITNYPKAPERELALQQQALLYGQLKDNNQMVGIFHELLSEYPKTSAAAQANFWMGWSAFESKDYTAAIPFLEQARRLDITHTQKPFSRGLIANDSHSSSKQNQETLETDLPIENSTPKAKGYFEQRATLRLLLAHYYLQHVEQTMAEAEALSTSSVPLVVAQWIGLKAYEQGKLSQAEKWLSLISKSNDQNLNTAQVELRLTQTLLQENKLRDALLPGTKARELSRDPQSRAEATLTLAKVHKGLKNHEQASSLVQETLLLQPEGSINMQARLLLGDLLYAQQDYDGAARAYRAITLLTQDPVLLKQALRQASEAYRHANNTTEADKAMKEYRLLESKK